MKKIILVSMFLSLVICLLSCSAGEPQNNPTIENAGCECQELKNTIILNTSEYERLEGNTAEKILKEGRSANIAFAVDSNGVKVGIAIPLPQNGGKVEIIKFSGQQMSANEKFMTLEMCALWQRCHDPNTCRIREHMSETYYTEMLRIINKYRTSETRLPEEQIRANINKGKSLIQQGQICQKYLGERFQRGELVSIEEKRACFERDSMGCTLIEKMISKYSTPDVIDAITYLTQYYTNSYLQVQSNGEKQFYQRRIDELIKRQSEIKSHETL
jgi:hypothetical protein